MIKQLNSNSKIFRTSHRQVSKFFHDFNSKMFSPDLHNMESVIMEIRADGVRFIEGSRVVYSFMNPRIINYYKKNREVLLRIDQNGLTTFNSVHCESIIIRVLNGETQIIKKVGKSYFKINY